ncbi:MAG: metallopeptidase [Polyangiaceae bacterium]
MSPARLALLALGLAFATGCKKSELPAAKTWYDAATLAESLRSEERAGAARSAGVKALNELPLYELELDLSDDLGRAQVTETLHFTNGFGVPLDELVLRVYINAVGDAPPVKVGKGACSEGPACSVSTPSPSVVVAKLDKPLGPGERVKLALALSAELRAIEPGRTSMLAQGLESLERLKSGKGAGDYGLLSRGEEIASLASFYAVLGRFRDGKWEKTDASQMGDLGADGLSHVRAKVIAPADAKVVSSGTTVGSAPAPKAEAGARRETRVVAALVRDFALMLSPRFETASRKVGDVEVRSHFLTRDKEAGERVLEAAASSLATFEKLFGRYPYVDLDVVEAPLVGGAGGVEFSGLVTVASMLYRPALTEGPLGVLAGLLGGGGGDAGMKQMTDAMLEFVTAHEVAHQWWPGLVGSDTRLHPFQDESFAQWSAVLYVLERHGPERAKLEAEREVLANYHTMRLFGVEDGAVDRPVEAFAGEVAYAGLVYGKGPFFFREVQKVMGDEAFFAAIRAYVARHRFKQAPPRGLVDALAKGQHEARVRALAKRWLEEAHGDEDLGKADMRKLLAGWIGEEAAKQMGPEVDVAMKLLLKLLGPGSGKLDAGDVLKELLAPGATP